MKLDNSDEIIVDFSEKEYSWDYEKFTCDKCDKQFDTKRSLKIHKSKVHKDQERVNFNANGNEHLCAQCHQSFETMEQMQIHIKIQHMKTKEVKKLKVRFKEVMDERARNEEWIKVKHSEESEEINYGEIKETPENTEKIKEAKEKELSNFENYKAYEEVEYDGQDILGTRYVLTEKSDGSIKARFVTKGFQEEFLHPSDSPTSSRETIKIFLAVAANNKWEIESSDATSAFLQSDNLDRDVYIEPPPERRKQGFVWKLRKPCYGLNDASRKWFISLKSTLLGLGMKQSKRESCLFYYLKENKLEGILVIHVDDVLSGGSDEFKQIMGKLRTKYTFGKVEKGSFIYNEYADDDVNKTLNKDENRMLRKSQGQLSWLATQTRPDLSFDSFNLSTVLNRATLRDGKLANKIIKKAKQEQIELKFSTLGNIEDLHLEIFADASLGNVESGLHTKSGMGYFICLANKNLDISPLHWKSCVIDKVAEDIKTAETLALEKALDDAIHISNLITEMYTGDATMNTLPIIANEDSNSLLESLYSTKKVKRKTMRVVVSNIQKHLQNGILTDIHKVKSKENIADVFTKAGVNTDRVLTVLRHGSLLNTDKKYENEVDATV